MIKRILKINNKWMKGSYEPILGYNGRLSNWIIEDATYYSAVKIALGRGGRFIKIKNVFNGINAKILRN